MRNRQQADHTVVAAACRTRPGQWTPVGEYNSSQSAEGVAGYIRKATTKTPAQQSAYSPAGSFETRCELTEYGARVEARYVGINEDAAWAEAVASLVGGAA